MHGFLGFNASFMLDVIVCALILVVPTILFSLYVVKFRHNYVLHRNIQVLLGVVLLLTVVAFEIDTQLVHKGWQNIVAQRTTPLTDEQFLFVRKVLWVHLVFAITTPFLWGTTLVLALKRFGSPPTPNAHSKLHSTLGWLSTVDIVMTSVTGLAFYYFAFVR